jgi:hypothetical protein
MDATSIHSKADYLAGCESLARKHFADNQMFVIYIRRRQPKFSTTVSVDRRDVIKNILDIYPNMTEKAYKAYKAAVLVDDSPLHDSMPSVEEFRTARSILRANASPLVGVVVAFKGDKDIKIGWSLCNLSKGDKFNQWDGIRRAIERAEPDVLISKRIELTEQVIAFPAKDREYVSPQKDTHGKPVLVPHTCLSALRRAVERAQKHLTPKNSLDE